MDEAAIQYALDGIFNRPLVFHGYTRYARDYELIVHEGPGHVRYLFRECVAARCDTTLTTLAWADDGYVWGVERPFLYPRPVVVRDSPAARRWSFEVGVDFHEVRLTTNVHELTLVFVDLEVNDLPSGYSPFVVPS